MRQEPIKHVETTITLAGMALLVVASVGGGAPGSGCVGAVFGVGPIIDHHHRHHQLIGTGIRFSKTQARIPANLRIRRATF